jgi:hypothetical protein
MTRCRSLSLTGERRLLPERLSLHSYRPRTFAITRFKKPGVTALLSSTVEDGAIEGAVFRGAGLLSSCSPAMGGATCASCSGSPSRGAGLLSSCSPAMGGATCTDSGSLSRGTGSLSPCSSAMGSLLLCSPAMGGATCTVSGSPSRAWLLKTKRRSTSWHLEHMKVRLSKPGTGIVSSWSTFIKIISALQTRQRIACAPNDHVQSPTF